MNNNKHIMKQIYSFIAGILLFSQTAMAATYTVTNTYDSGNGSFRKALTDANANVGKDIINFNIPGAGPHIITLFSALPQITEQITIDGYSQPQSYPGTADFPAKILCVIDFNLMGSSGIEFTFSSGTSDISGLSIVNATGGSSAGIYLNNCALTNITGNMIGLYPDGSGGGNYVGIKISGTDNTVIGGSDANRNIISYNYTYGILIENIAANEATGSSISYNYIGTDATGKIAMGNIFDGIHVSLCDNTIITNNIISSNSGNGIYLNGTATNAVVGTTIEKNRIGLAKTNAVLENSLNGIELNYCQNTIIGGSAAFSNVIAHNSLNGIVVTGNLTSTGNQITYNSIYLNTLLGIDLNNDGNTANDSGDADSGPNSLQNYPVIDSAVMNGANLIIYGKFNGTLAAPVRLEFFNNPLYVSPLDISGHGEGYTSIGTLNVVGTGADAAFTFSVSGFSIYQDYITATATNTTSLSTSEFSAYKQISSNIDNVCFGPSPVNKTYTVSSVPLATSYTWTVPATASITSGQGTTSINVDWGGVSVGSYTVCVVANSSCGTSPSSCFPILVKTCCTNPTSHDLTYTACSGTQTSVSLPTAGDNSSPITKYTITAVADPGLSGTPTVGTNLTDPASISTDIFTNATNGQLNVTYTVVPSSGTCVGASFTITVTVNPAPTMLDPADLAICNVTGPAISLTTNISGPTVSYSWSTTGDAGISGYSNCTVSCGTTINQILTNIGTSTGTATYVITPKIGSCSGTTQTVIVTVNPTPQLNDPVDVAICSGSQTNIGLTTPISGATITYSWTTSASSGNLSGYSNCASSCGTSIQQTLSNSGNTQETVSYTVTPHIGSCSGTTQTVVVTVKPVPSINLSPLTQTVCPGSSFTITASNPNSVPGVVYNWSRTNDAVLSGVLLTGSGSPTGTFASSDPQNSHTTTFTVTVSASSCSSNTTASVTVLDNSAPTITCPTNQNISCSSLVQTAATNYAEFILLPGASVSDVCPGTITVAHIGDAITNLTCVNKYTITRTYRATDANGNTAECQQTITVNDNVNPTATAPADITGIKCIASIPAANVALITDEADNCGATPTVVLQSSSNNAGAGCVADPYILTRTYRITDACGNFIDRIHTITVIDDVNPTINTLAANLTVDCDGTGNTIQLNNWLNSHAGASATDNCSGITWSHNFTALSNLCGATGAATVVFSATDACGNSSATSATFTIQDNTAPIITTCAPIQSALANISCQANVPDFISTSSASDICGSVIISQSPPAGTTVGLGVTPITITATDECGNFSTCSSSFTVNSLTISGTVFDDANGISNSLIDGSTLGIAGASQLYANLTQGGLVVGVVPVSHPSGNYTLDCAEGVVPNTSYTVILSSTQGTIGMAVAASLPLGWVNTAEGTAIGDGLVDGKINVNITTSVITNTNFGIDQLPTPIAVDPGAQFNPGGTNNVIVPATSFTGTDPESPAGFITQIHISNFPTNTTSITINGTTYTSVTWPVGGFLIPTNAAGNPTQIITIDPFNGNVTAQLAFSVLDNAGKESPTTSVVDLDFIDLTLSGTLYDDANGLIGIPANTVDGFSMNLGNAMYVNLVSSSNTVLTSILANINGTYSFGTADGILMNTSYNVILTNGLNAVGSLLTSASLPVNWVSTGENIGAGAGNDGSINSALSISVVAVSITNANFGFDQLPFPVASDPAPQFNPGGSNNVILPSSAFSGYDLESVGYITQIYIQSFPSNINSITIDGTNYTSGSWPVGGVYIPTNALGNTSVPISIDPIDGNTTAQITFSVFDNAGKESASTDVLYVQFYDLTISGHVFDDANGLLGVPVNTVDGTLTNAGGNIYANLVNASNVVLFSASVTAGGLYSFGNANGVQINTSYNVILTNGISSIGTTLTTATLPVNWVSSGENLGAGTGNDGSVNSMLTIAVATAPVTNANFGVDQLPSPIAVNPAPQFNPGGTNNVTVPATSFNGSDPESPAGFISQIHIVSFPTNATSITINGTTYTSATWPAGGSYVPTNAAGNPTQLITIDPDNGNLTAQITFSVVDNAGKESTSTGVVNLLFNDLTLSGNIFDDANGLLGVPVNTVDGIPTNAGGLLYANLVNGSNQVIASVAVSAGGIYSFGTSNGVQLNTSYNVILSNGLVTIGNTVLSATLPANWVSSGENFGAGTGNDGSVNSMLTIAVTTTPVANANFGIDQLPTPIAVDPAAQFNPGGTNNITVPATSFTGTDPENPAGFITQIRIISFPTNTTSITINGTTYTSGTWPGIGIFVPSNAAGNPTQIITIDPDNGNLTAQITFSVVDNAGKESATSDVVDLQFNDITLSGNLYDDANGLQGIPANTVDGTPTNSGGTIYANLVNGANQVLASVAVSATGTYIFGTGNGIQINSSFNVILTNGIKPLGNTLTAADLPLNFVSTGENLGAGVGNDGNANSILTIAIVGNPISNANFGVDQLPDSNPISGTYVNPGGTIALSVPPIGGSDPEDGLYGPGMAINIVSIPANGILYYNGLPVIAGQTISNYNPALLTIDPLFNGAGTVIFTYAAIDAAGKQDQTPAIATINFTSINLYGHVFDDGNGMANGVVDGLLNYAGNTLYANLVYTGTGIVADVVPVTPVGIYQFLNQNGNNSYTIILSDFPGTAGSLAPVPNLPTPWVNTGEHAGAGPGSDGLVNGMLNVTTLNVDVADLNFGIDRTPAVYDYTMAAQFNPGGLMQIPVPSIAFSGSDAEDGVYTGSLTGRNVILYPALNGTLFYNGIPVVAAMNIPSFNPNLASIDPDNGDLSTSFTYTAFDNANVADPTPNTISLPFFDIKVSGTVFDDGNGMLNGFVDGTGTNAVSTLYINLVSSISGIVFATVPVNPNGTYQFSNLGIPSNTNFNLILSTTAGIPGNSSPIANLPFNWINTGEHLGATIGNDGIINGTLSVNTGTASLNNANFGIDQLPQTSNTSATFHNPGGTATVLVPTLSGSDPEDGVLGTGMTFEINSIPANATLYYNGIAVVIGQIITNFNPGLLTLDPLFDGSGSVSFTYAAIDAAGKQDPSPATSTIIFTGINLLGNVYDDANGLQNSTVDGLPTNAGGVLYVNLIDVNTNLVLGVSSVSPAGTYQFLNVFENSSYKILLSSVSGTIGTSAPAATLASPWLNTGENIGSGLGNDGTVNGIIIVNSLNSDINNINFGIEQPPAVTDYSVPSQVNPGGIIQINVPAAAFNGNDFEDGIYPLSLSGRKVQLFPATNAVLYYLGVPVLSPLIINAFNPNMVSIDPVNGNTTAAFNYTTYDNAGIQDATPGIISLTFTGITIAGNVFDDANGLNNNLVDGTGTSVGGSLFINLVNAGTGIVVAVTPVNPDGSYIFSGPLVTLNTSFNLVLSINSGNIGNPVPTIALPGNWTNTGEHLGNTVGNDGVANGILPVFSGITNTANANFGIDQLPNSNNVFAAYINPGGISTLPIPALTGTDPEDGIYGTGSTIVFTSLPLNGTIYYNNVALVNGQTILNYNPALLTVDPLFNTSGSIVFNYSNVDAAGKLDPSPAIVTIDIYSCANSVVVPTSQNQCGAIAFNLDPQPPLGNVTYSLSGATTGSGNGTASGHFFNIGLTIVSYTITDIHGNIMTCSFTVTVIDMQPPSITCPSNITVNNTTNLCTGIASFIVTFSDNCPGSTISQISGLPSGGSFPVGTTTNTFRATDAYGNSSTCSFNVTVIDNQAPTIVCPANISKSIDPTHCFATLIIPAPVVNDNCGVLSYFNNITGSGNASGTFGVGTTNLVWTVIDTHGNTASCTMNIVVYDNEIPVIVCPANITKNVSPGQCQATVTVPAPMKSDNCGIASVINSYNGSSNASGVYPVGSTNVTWTATDIHGNTASCTMSILVVDNQNPVVICPANITQTNAAGLCNAVVNVPVPATSDNCGVNNLLNSFNNTANASGTYPVGSTVVLWTVTDIHGNSSSCSMTVTITDSQNPVITCPANKTVNTNPNACFATGVVLGTPTTSDNCGVATVISNAPSSYPKGLNTVTWIVTDTHGNTASCLQTVLVVDNQNPVITCPANITTNTNSGTCQATGINLGAPVAIDNCPGLTVTNNAPGVYPLGNTTITWTVTDGSGLVATCNQIVTIVDNQNPVIVCPANITANASPGLCSASGLSLGTPVTSDNCSGILTITNNAPASFPVGLTNVIWAVTDASGRTSTCTQTITIVDNQAPSISCPANKTVNSTAGICGATGVNLGNPVTTDNCSVATTTNNAPGIFPIGNTNVIWTVTDNHGKTATCLQTVTVIDNQLPTIICPANKTVYTNAGQCLATGVSLGTPTTGDNCQVISVTNNAPASYPLGSTTVKWIVTDAAGLTASCTQSVFVADNQAPVIGPTLPVIVQLNSNCSATGVTLIPPAVTDNCAITSFGNNSPLAYPLGTTIVTWTAVDASGNSSSATQTVTVLDNIPPVITCPGPTTLFTDSGVCSANPLNIPAATATDNCSGVTITNNTSGNLPLGISTVIWTATDASGNSASCESKVTVIDNQPPTIICPPNITQVETTFVVVDAPVVGDNCGIASVTNNFNNSNNATGVYPPGTTEVTWTVTDINGNSSSCSQFIVINCQLHAYNDTTTIMIDDSAHVHVIYNDTLCGSPVQCSNITILVDPYNYSVYVDSLTGAIVCMPLPGFVGSDSLEYEICCSITDPMPLNPNGSSPAPNSYTVCATAWLFLNTIPASTASISGSATICQGGTAAMLVSLTGTPPFQIKISDGGNIWTYSGILSTTLTIPVNPTITSTYHLVSVKDASGIFGTTSGSATITVNVLNTYVITGGGNYCPGSAGLIIGLSGSDPGVSYQLFRNNTAVGAPTIGTGLPLNFGYQTAVGIYSIIATSATNFCSRNMSGNTTINMFPVVNLFNVTGGGECCFGCTDVHVYLNGSVQGVVYNLWNGTTLISTLFGTGLPIDFGYMTSSGYYTISGTNAYGCSAFMNGGAVVVLHPPAEGELLTSDTTICQGQSITLGIDLTSGSGPWTVVVSNGSGNITYDSIWCSPFFFTVTPDITRTYTLVSVSDAFGCFTLGSGTTTVTVLQIPVVSHLPVQAVCTNALPFAVSGGVPSGGFYMGPGILNGVFNPGLSGAGLFDILYTVSSGNGCQASTIVTITVNSLPVVSSTTLNPVYCHNAASVNLIGNHAPSGIFTGPGVTNNGNGTAVFSPILAGEGGPYAISYTYTNSNGCTASYNQMVAVTGTGTGCSIGVQASYCLSSNNYPIYGFPAGGVFTGPGIVNGSLFNPAIAGPGIHSLTYSVNQGGCVNTATQFVTVTSTPVEFHITGGGHYCAGNAGVEIGLNGSQQGITYTLLHDNTPTNQSSTGTGNPITFGYQNIEGSYTISATQTSSNCDGMMIGSTVVTMNPLPIVTMDSLPAICSNAEPIILSQGNPAGGYYSGIGVTDSIFDPTIAGFGDITLLYTFTDQYHCSSSASNIIHIDSCGFLRISGSVNYDNSVATPMNNTNIILKRDGTIIQTTVSNNSGHYQFTNITPAVYTIEANCNKPWGGVNASDALMIMKHFAHLTYLTGLAKVAADIDGNNVVNAIDALMVSKRFTNLIASFPTDDWRFESHTITINATDGIANIKGICSGDVNNSYLPPSAMVEPTIDLGHAGTINIQSFESFELPITTNTPLITAAVSMIMKYPADELEVLDVRMQGNENIRPVFNSENGELRIAWYNNENPIVLTSGDILFTILFKAKDLANSTEGYINLELDGSSEIANQNAATIRGIELVSPKLIVEKQVFTTTIKPNPVRNQAELTYTIPANGILSVQLFDMTGNLVKMLADEISQQVGYHTITIDACELPTGMYMYRMILRTENAYYQTTNKLIISKE